MPGSINPFRAPGLFLPPPPLPKNIKPLICNVFQGVWKETTGAKWAETKGYTGVNEMKLALHDGGPYHVEISLLICRANQ